MNPNDPEGHGCNVYHEAVEQPLATEHYTADDVYIRQCVVPKKDSLIPQHSHTYPHMTMLAKGSMRVWKDGVLLGDEVAPKAIFIEAGTKHGFQTLEDDTIFYCIHNVMRTGQVEIDKKHEIVGKKCPGA